ncbi:MBL fold metallo-hydrolase [Spongiibacter nanhainus]|uniref:MBL fold metallo-hydrolase n=1 Tax=Spongiibacter nanhainus TaxID=2794344 RepID=A0A7T4UPB1_9GAMM|nr:MBL fold metallo-hydrolase [Spongiibacter nanhainus]QQD16853.1 MBL fold metallo-hydrolase [Spongiibacter nanhainus]
MSLRFASLGSGSKGNGTLVATADSCVLVDCGFTLKETRRRLERLGVAPEQLSAILVTHEHSDHIKGVLPLAKKYELPVFTSFGTAEYGEMRSTPWWRCLSPGDSEEIAGIDIQAVPVPHDAREPCQFVFRHRSRSLGLLTDLGSVTPVVRQHYAECDALVLECNHDVPMLEAGPYPPSLKRRVGGDWGHLNNGQAASLLSSCEIERLQHLVMAHLSEQNNTPALARSAIEPHMQSSEALLSADQEAGFDWLEIA